MLMTGKCKTVILISSTSGFLGAHLFFYFQERELIFMKYCPYCGLELQNSNVSFCSECGKKLNDDNDERSQTPKSKNKSKFHSKKKVMSPEKTQQSLDEQADDVSSKSADGYDGYYDDVLPSDEGRQQAGIDKELLKKIVLLVAGVLVISGICVVFMSLV